MNGSSLIPHLFRTEYSKIIAVLCKTFGLQNIQLAEDITSDTFLIATETWSLNGVPDKPRAWLYAVAKNKARDSFKRQALYMQKIEPYLRTKSDIHDSVKIDISEENITDSQLQMIFAVCNPILNKESQICLALRILCGFGIDEIASAFISNKETISKRLHRAKTKLKKENIKIEFPPKAELQLRLQNVLSTIYLLFNEGYYSTSKPSPLRKELCIEAMRLCHMLLNYPPTNHSQTNALMALMCFHSSRFDARIDATGNVILYDDQNRDDWDEDLISKGTLYMQQSTAGEHDYSKYQLEAGIAFLHSSKSNEDTKWELILQLYNRLLQIDYSPITALNRTYALAKTRGKAIAIEEALKIDLKDNHLFHCLLSYLYENVDDIAKQHHLQQALDLAKTESDKELIRKKIR